MGFEAVVVPDAIGAIESAVGCLSEPSGEPVEVAGVGTFIEVEGGGVHEPVEIRGPVNSDVFFAGEIIGKLRH